jgi:hypothetical protein
LELNSAKHLVFWWFGDITNESGGRNVRRQGNQTLSVIWGVVVVVVVVVLFDCFLFRILQRRKVKR